MKDCIKPQMMNWLNMKQEKLFVLNEARVWTERAVRSVVHYLVRNEQRKWKRKASCTRLSLETYHSSVLSNFHNEVAGWVSVLQVKSTDAVKLHNFRWICVRLGYPVSLLENISVCESLYKRGTRLPIMMLWPPCFESWCCHHHAPTKNITKCGELTFAQLHVS